MEATAHSFSEEIPLVLYPLVFLTEGDEVTIGRTETDSYAIFPSDGAEVVRRLQTGMTPREVRDWYADEFGETIDVAHIVAALEELGFLQSSAAPTGTLPTSPIRGQQLGVALFSPPAWAAYLAVVTWAVIAACRSTDLVPTYHNLFFTQYYAAMEVVLIVGVLPLLMGHEAFHVLAARRIGVRSSLGISRRLYFVVLETRMDGLVAVPRRRRYLPILAGIVFDVVVTAVLVVTADLTRASQGQFSFVGRLCLAFAFTTILRVAWQFYLYLRTDLYVLCTTMLGCTDLHGTTRRLITDQVDRLLHRRRPRADRSTWPPLDRRIARWWAWFVVAGYAFSIGTLLVAVLPLLVQIAHGLLERLTGASTSTARLLDTAVFLILTIGQVAVSLWLSVRERRHHTTFHHVLS